MLKYVFNVFDKYSGEKIDQVIVPAEAMLETLEALNKLGMVKGYILDDSKEEK